MPFRIARAFLILLGALIAVAALAIDYLLPGTSPGLNLPQILAIAVGLAIAFLAWRLRIERLGKLSPARMARGILVVAIITGLTLLILELAMTAWGMPTYYPAQVDAEGDYEFVYWRFCDDLGCRMNYESVIALCDAGKLQQQGARRCKSNRQGYPDSHDFAADDALASQRVLAVGDSFTQGFTADIGSSFVETLEAAIPEAVVWNSAIFGTSTKHQLATFRHLAPQLRPQLSILGFFTNDFSGNAVPLNWEGLLHDYGDYAEVLPVYMSDRWGNVLTLPPELAYAYARLGIRPPASEIERLTGLTRLGTLFLRSLDLFAESARDRSWRGRVDLTRNYLRDMRDVAGAHGSQLLVIVIPRREDLQAPSEEHATAIALMEELALPYIRAIDYLVAADYARKPDGHWSNSGHQKIGKLLSECVSSFFAGADLGECPPVTVK